MQLAHGTNRDRLQAFDLERTLFNEAFETTNGHLVQAAFNFGEFSRSVVSDMSAPSAQGLFGEDEVGPRKNGKQVST